MTFATADLYDDYGDKLTVLRSQFRHFGARRSFGGRVLTLKVFEDNSLVKSLLATPGEGRVLVVDGEIPFATPFWATISPHPR